MTEVEHFMQTLTQATDHLPLFRPKRIIICKCNASHP